MNKKAQSEMVGFALIIIIVAILILVFLSVSLKKSSGDPVESYEVESFLQSFLEHTTDCALNYNPNYLSVRKLIFACEDEKSCFDGRSSCEALNESVIHLMNASWDFGPNLPTKGYNLNITSKGEELFGLERGNQTTNKKGSSQTFDGGIDLYFIIYS